MSDIAVAIIAAGFYIGWKIEDLAKAILKAFEDGKKEVIDHPDKYGLTKQKPVESIEGGVLTHLGNED